MSIAYPAAVLFDMDGTLIDSEHHWLSSEQELASEVGAEVLARCFSRMWFVDAALFRRAPVAPKYFP